MTGPDLRNRHMRLLGAGTPLFYGEPVHIVRGDGVWLFDDAGRRYLDAYNNVPCVGHANGRVANAMANQAATLNVHSRYLHEGVLDYAERLTRLHAEPLSTVVFACTGTEANEVAIMMARAASGGEGIITTDAAYHGNSTEIRKPSGIGARKSAGAGRSRSAGVRAVPVPDAAPLLGAGMSSSGARDHHLDLLREQIDGFVKDGVGFAGVMMCSILANEGLPTIPDGYMSGAAALVRDAGGFFIADEVQAGFARSGRWWGYETSSFVPDITTMGKPMGAGLPIAAVVANNELVTTFRKQTRYFNTFAASPLQAAVGMAVIDEIEDRGLVENARDVGAYLLDGVCSIAADHAAVASIRGRGLFIAIDWVDVEGRPDVAGAQGVVDAMKDSGILMGKSGAYHNVLKLRPPLVFEQEHADIVIAALGEVISGSR